MKKSSRQSDDILEVKLSDSLYEPYFKAKARVSKQHEMKLLAEGLKEKGVILPK